MSNDESSVRDDRVRLSSVDPVLASPRGLVALARLCGEDLDLWSTTAPPSEVDVANVLGAGLTEWRVDPSSGELVSTDRSVDVLADQEALALEVMGSVDGLAWWPERERLGGLVRHSHVFAAAAAQLLEVGGSRWWAEDFVMSDQVVLGPPDVPPDLDALAAEQEELLRRSWRLPQVLTSSRRLGTRLPAVRLGASEAVVRWGQRFGCWAVRVSPRARIVEIHRPEDWQDLCTRYPSYAPTPDDYARWGVVGDVAVWPDWDAVARDWDGVHVSMLGLMTAVGVTVDVDGAGGVLEDVDSELTVWLRPRIDSPHRIAVCDVADLR